MAEESIESPVKCGCCTLDSKSGETRIYGRLSMSDRKYLEQLKDEVPLGQLSVEEERARMRAGQISKLEDFRVTTQIHQSRGCRVHIIKPEPAQAPLPITFYLHGGGWVLGDLSTHTRLVCELTVRSGCAIGFVEYPLAPQNPFPEPLESCLDAITGVLSNATALGLDARRFALAGDSSGGNLAAACILLARGRGMPLPCRQVLLYPVVDCSPSTPSYKDFAHNPNLSQQTMNWFWDQYLPEESARTSPLASPLRASDQALLAFPPTLLVTCEYDVLRDEAEEFASRLIRMGVDTTVVRWLGALHGFLVTESLSQSSSANACIDLIADYLRKGLTESC